MAKENTQPKLENHDKVAEQRVDAIKMMQQSDQNAVRMGVTVSKMEVILGNEIIDKKTNQPMSDGNGGTKKYASKYYVTLDFNGGTIKTLIDFDTYQTLKIGSRYSAHGRIAPVSNFGNVEMQPVFNKFIFLYGNEDF